MVGANIMYSFLVIACIGRPPLIWLGRGLRIATLTKLNGTVFVQINRHFHFPSLTVYLGFYGGFTLGGLLNTKPCSLGSSLLSPTTSLLPRRA